MTCDSTILIPTLALCSWLAVPAVAQSVPEVKLPPSPPGQAAIQVGGTWTKTQDGGQRYEGGKWIVVDYSRPTLKGRTNIFGSGTEYGKVVSDGDACLACWRQRHDHADDAGAACGRRQDAGARRLQRVRGTEARRHGRSS